VRCIRGARPHQTARRVSRVSKSNLDTGITSVVTKNLLHGSWEQVRLRPSSVARFYGLSRTGCMFGDPHVVRPNETSRRVYSAYFKFIYYRPTNVTVVPTPGYAVKLDGASEIITGIVVIYIIRSRRKMSL
jgi:hypothetical protein